MPMRIAGKPVTVAVTPVSFSASSAIDLISALSTRDVASGALCSVGVTIKTVALLSGDSSLLPMIGWARMRSASSGVRPWSALVTSGGASPLASGGPRSEKIE